MVTFSELLEFTQKCYLKPVNSPKSIQFADSLKYDAQGLITAVAQDAATKDVLMVAHMNREAVLRTLEGPHVWYFSRSRNKLWKKGETSGHLQVVMNVFIDCDRDALIVSIEQLGAACHDGYKSCFYTELNEGEEVIHGTPISGFNTKE